MTTMTTATTTALVRLASGILIATALTAADARAQNFPWCANFADGAGTNCGFATYEQCMATSQGSGGSCDKNNAYRPGRRSNASAPSAAQAPCRQGVLRTFPKRKAAGE